MKGTSIVVLISSVYLPNFQLIQQDSQRTKSKWSLSTQYT